MTRPTSALLYVILSPVGPYFKTGTLSPVALLADPAFVRAWPGGCGDFKLGGYVIKKPWDFILWFVKLQWSLVFTELPSIINYLIYWLNFLIFPMIPSKIGHFGNYHNTLPFPPQIEHKLWLFLFSLGTIVSPKRNWKQCLCKIWGDKQRVLWYFS